MKRSPIRPQSAKRRRVNRARWELAADHLDEPCRIRSEVCTGWAEHFHELVGRRQGGSLTDPRNLVPSCDRCNGWIEDYPELARDNGWKVHQAQSMRAEDGFAVPINPNPLAIAWDEDGVA